MLIQFFHTNGLLSCCLVERTISFRYANSLSAAMRRSFSLAKVSSKNPIWLSTSLCCALLLLPLTALSDDFQRLPALSLLTLERVLQLCGRVCEGAGDAPRDAVEVLDTATEANGTAARA